MSPISIRIDDALLERARKTADEQHTTVTQLLIDGLIAELDRRAPARVPMRVIDHTSGQEQVVYIPVGSRITISSNGGIAIALTSEPPARGGGGGGGIGGGGIAHTDTSS